MIWRILAWISLWSWRLRVALSVARLRVRLWRAERQRAKRKPYTLHVGPASHTFVPGMLLGASSRIDGQDIETLVVLDVDNEKGELLVRKI